MYGTKVRHKVILSDHTVRWARVDVTQFLPDRELFHVYGVKIARCMLALGIVSYDSMFADHSNQHLLDSQHDNCPIKNVFVQTPRSLPSLVNKHEV